MTAPNSAEAGSASVDIYPDATNFEPRLRADVEPAAERVGRTIGQKIAKEIARPIIQAIRDGVRQGGIAARPGAEAQGRSIGDRMGREIRSRIEARLRTPIKVKLDADDSGVNAAIAAIRARLAAVSESVIIDADIGAAETKLGALQATIRAVVEKVNIDADTAAAEAKITALQATISGLSGNTINIRARVIGEAAINRLTTALAALAAIGSSIDIDVKVSMTGAPLRDITRLTTALRGLTGVTSPVRIDIDVNATGPLAEVARLRSDLRSLQRATNPLVINIEMRGVMQAIADLHTIAAFARTVGTISPHVTVTVNATLAIARLAVVLGMAASVGAMRPTVTVNINISGLVPAQAGLAAVQGQALGAGASVGFLGAAFALLALLAIPAIAAVTVAVMGLVTALAVLGAGALVGVLALSGVVGAVQAMGAAQDEAGKSAAGMAQKQNAAAGAAQQYRAAERSLADALREVTRAQEGLTEARVDAKRAIEDLNASVRTGAIDIRQATLDQADAKTELDKVLADPAATDAQKEQAQINYDRAVANLDDLKRRQERLKQEQLESVRVGVEGSDQVRDAQERLRAAQERVIAAQEQISAAHRAQAQALQGVETAGGSAMDTLNKKMAALSPAGREFVRFIFGLKDELNGLRQAAEAGFLPGLQRGIQAFLPMLPLVQSFISKVATAAGIFVERILTGLTSPTWVRFFTWLGDIAGPIMGDFATILMAVGEGLAELLMAFGESSESFVSGLARMALAFSAWAKGVAQSEGFKEFLAYARENGPVVVSLLADFAVVVIKLGIALAPLAQLTLRGLATFFGWLASLDPGVLIGIAAAIAVVGLALAIAFGGPTVIIGFFIAALVAVYGALTYAYKNVEWFRNAVDAAWKVIAAVSVWLWQNVLLPIFKAWWEFAQVMAKVYLWLWNEVIVPAWNGIVTAAKWAWDNVLQPVFKAIVWYVQNVLGPVYTWLYENVIKHVWSMIQVAISVAWASIQVIFGLIVAWVKILGAIYTWLWENAVGPAWRAISALISSVWNQQIKPVLSTMGDFISEKVAPAFRRGVDLLGFWWKALIDLFKTPVRIIVTTVLNDGLLGAYRWIAEKFNLPNKDVSVKLPQGFATGGFVSGPGTATSDSIMARLSNGEYVIPAGVVEDLGVEFFDWLIGRKKSMGNKQRPGDGSEGLAFADGGVVPGYAKGGLVGWLEGAWNALTDPVGALKDRVAGLLDGIPGGTMGKDLVGGLAKKAIDGVIAWVKTSIANMMSVDGAYTGPITADVAAVQNWVRAQNGKPYIWASAGPRGYDCSGAVSAVWNLLHGRSAYSHTFSTMNQAPYFPKRGMVGVLTAGWANAGERGGGSVGHTAANLAGLPFESTGSRGFHTQGVTPYSSFAHWGTFDSGGLLLPGITVAYNGTGRPERILTEQQWDSMAARNAGGSTTYATNIYPLKTQLDIEDLKAYDARRDALARVGRPK